MSDNNPNAYLEALSLNKIRALFGCGHHTLYAEIMAGVLPAFKVGNSIRVLRTDIEAYIETKRVKNQYVPFKQHDYYGGCSKEMRKLADEFLLKPKRAKK